MEVMIPTEVGKNRRWSFYEVHHHLLESPLTGKELVVVEKETKGKQEIILIAAKTWSNTHTHTHTHTHTRTEADHVAKDNRSFPSLLWEPSLH